MRCLVRPSIVLFATYGLVLAIFLASISAGGALRSSADLCISWASLDASGPPPAKQKTHDLVCLTGCGLAMIGFVPPISSFMQLAAFSLISWNGHRKKLRQSNSFGALFVRGPPMQV